MPLTVIHRPLKNDQYYQSVFSKSVIYLHHTAGSHRADWTIDNWNSDTRGRVATAYVIGGKGITDGDLTFDGKIYRAFDDRYWAHHLGVKAPNNTVLNQKSVGIEICNYGPIRKTASGVYLNYVNREVPSSDVYRLATPWRGYEYFHRYTSQQLTAVAGLIHDIAGRYAIPITKHWSQNSFNMNSNALAGSAGIWTHANVRSDKTDCHPQPELIEMLNGL